MRFARVNNERTAPSKGLKGQCPVCDSPVIARCGPQRAWHWAHRGERVCDHWWEPETEWHRGWKNKFPSDWQEITRHDLKGERHIADIHTPFGLTMEFQRSHLRPDERNAREFFYGNMLWVVDGTRLLRDLPRFLVGMRTFLGFAARGIFVTLFPEEAFAKEWLNCNAPVCFDFGSSSDPEVVADRSLWCLLPGRTHGLAIVVKVSQTDLVRWAHEKTQPIPVLAIHRKLARSLLPGSVAAPKQTRYLLIGPMPPRPRRRRRKGGNRSWTPNPPVPKKPRRWRRGSF